MSMTDVNILYSTGTVGTLPYVGLSKVGLRRDKLQV